MIFIPNRSYLASMFWKRGTLPPPPLLLLPICSVTIMSTTESPGPMPALSWAAKLFSVEKGDGSCTAAIACMSYPSLVSLRRMVGFTTSYRCSILCYAIFSEKFTAGVVLLPIGSV